MPKPFYITTPIYYVNDRPHIGHIYTTVLADVAAHFHRQLGEPVYFLTGTDEHGQKVEKAAAARGIEPKALADEVVTNYFEVFKRMGFTHDRFIRTTDADHRAVVQARFKELLEKGDIYKAEYEGLYSVSDEAYVTEIQAKELQAQGLAHQLVTLKEECYFFRLSAYQDRLLAWYQAHPDFVQPDFRFNEVKRFVESGLQDLSISRTTIKWGIPVPGDEAHVVYVWFDALLNYLSGCPEGGWPPDLQLVGKDILRFHAVYWPAFLMAMELPLPQTILAHGWWLMGDSKMSKSLGNIVRPEQLLRFGVDAARFYLMRDMQVGHDRSFSYEGFMERLNADLANGLGNLAARSISMIKKYRDGVIPVPSSPLPEPTPGEGRLMERFLDAAKANRFDEALDALWTVLRGMDGLIVQVQPWKIAKDETQDPQVKAQLDQLLEQLWQTLRVAAALVAPIMPDLSQQLWEGIGMPGKAADQRLDQLQWRIPAPGPVGDPKPLFARIDKEAEMQEMENAAAAAQAPVAGTPAASALDVPPLREPVDYDTFARTDLRVGKVLEAERVPKSDKLIKMKVDLGFELRTIVGGIGKAYAPEELTGRQVVVVANLAPRKLMGIESHGMLLAASDNAGLPYLIAPPSDAKPGFIVK